MSLDIGVGDGKSFVPLPDEPRLAFDDDGYLFFLFPFLRSLHHATGEMIDLYDDASFSGDHLDLLQTELRAARVAIDAQPEQWDIPIGTQFGPPSTHPPVGKPIISTVEKAVFLERLDQWERVIRRARETGRPVVCFGD